MILQKKYIIIFLLISSTGLFGQMTSPGVETCKSEFDSLANRLVYTKVDSMPTFPNGEDSLYAFISKNIKIVGGNATYSGTVYVSFIIETDGSLTNKRLIKGFYCPADEEVLRLIDIMPDWIPGKCEGILVPVKFIFPLKFNVEF